MTQLIVAGTDVTVSRRLAIATKVKNGMIANSMSLAVLCVLVYFSFASPHFATAGNLATILVAAAPFALIACGQTLVILTGGIDLSVGSVIALAAMSGAIVAKANPEALWLGIAVAVAAGLACGAVNGILVAGLNLPAFVATLAMLTTASGLAYVVGGGAPINGIPAGFGAFANTTLFGLELPVWLMFLVLAVLALLMRRTTYGTRVYAVGGNITAARIAGIKVRGVLFSVYAVSGALAGLAGGLLSSRVVTAAPTLGAGYELDAIAAVVIGGASLMGGRGTIWGTLIGLLLIQTLNNGLDLLLVPSYWQSVIKGTLIATAVAVDVFVTRRKS
ncbi:ABC transporter permease [Acrocarpospora pleiomorpha]|uniref:ABC transporter permease n=1 Tax=Acrocarpospora pleiomorpha TaxID=90975 RepID=A0A5M3Y4W9_9ACTN|nr:ABC transporter permease [Acrocarpospora pleiomorpha]GES26088.1 ABC transporter permease [Acrocarpospora pleiomorpha]